MQRNVASLVAVFAILGVAVLAPTMMVSASGSSSNANGICLNNASGSISSGSSGLNCSLVPTTAAEDVPPEMTWKAWVAIVIVMGVLVVLTFELISVTAAMVGSSVLLWLTTIIKLNDMFVGFVNGGVISIVLFFIIVKPLADLPLVQMMISKSLSGGRNYPRWPLFKICFLSMMLSSLLDNIPQVAMFTPLVKEYCRMEKLSPSQFLMPMAFAVLLGNYALIGASNNLVVSGLMEDAGMAPMEFFELAKITGVASLFGLAYLVIVPHFLLPRDKGGMFRLVEEQGRSFLMQIRVRRESVLIGTKTEDLPAEFPSLGEGEVDLIEIDRGHYQITHFSGQEVLQEGDILVLSGAVSTIVSSLQTLGLDYHFESDLQFQRQNTATVMENLQAEGHDDHEEKGVVSRTPPKSPEGEEPDLDNEPFDFTGVGQEPGQKRENDGDRKKNEKANGKEAEVTNPEPFDTKGKKADTVTAESDDEGGSPLVHQLTHTGEELQTPKAEEQKATKEKTEGAPNPSTTPTGNESPVVKPEGTSVVPKHHSALNKDHAKKGHCAFIDEGTSPDKKKVGCDDHRTSPPPEPRKSKLLHQGGSAGSSREGTPRAEYPLKAAAPVAGGGSGVGPTTPTSVVTPVHSHFPDPSRSASYLSNATHDPELTNMSFMRTHTAHWEEEHELERSGGSFASMRTMSFMGRHGGGGSFGGSWAAGEEGGDTIPDPMRNMSFTRGNAQYVEASRMYEVVLSGDCPSIGTTLAAGAFTHRYNVTLMALRTAEGAKDLTGANMMSHQLSTGDTLLCMAPKTFGEEWRGSFDFLLISEFSDRRDVVLKENFFTLPHWFCVGRPLGRGEKAAKVLKVPAWYPYLSLASFFGVVIAAIVGIELHAAAMIAVCFLVVVGIMDTKQAVSYIDWNSLLMVAFSFGLGKAVSKSGLAAVIGYWIIKAQITGFPLLLLTSFLTSGLANIVTNKAAAQVMFPIIYQVYSGSGKDPLPGIMVLAACSVMPMMTPHGIASNVMVMGPGGYVPKDYLKFGAPLQIMMGLIVPLSAAIVYSEF